MALNLDTLVIHIIINIIVISPSLWLAGRALVGKEKAKFTDSIAIVAVGTVLGAIFGAFFTGFLALIIQLIIWLGLIKHFFDCGWVKALAIAIVAIIIFVIIAVILGLMGFALIHFL